jgi:ATP-dependent Zn protease
MDFVQYKILDYLKFDNEIINVMIMIIAPIIFNYMRNNYQNIKVFFTFNRFTSMKINRISNNFYHNDMYFILVWFINKQKIENNDTIASYIDTFDSKNGSVNVLIGRNIKTRITLDESFGKHKGKVIYITNVYKKIVDGAKICVSDENFYIQYYARNKCILTPIINQIKDFYYNEKKLKTWESKIFFIEKEKEKLEWTSYSMENYTTFDTLILDDSTRRELKNDVNTFIQSEEEYKKKGLVWSRGYLFYGVPGCGKTSLIKAISNFSKMNVYSFDLNMIESDDELRHLFRSIPKKSIIIFEDIDCLSTILHDRETQNKKVEKKEDIKVKTPSFTLSGLLNELDGIANTHGKIKIMTTNFKEKLDTALIRPGRMDFSMELQKASREQIIQSIKLQCSDIDKSNIIVHDSHVDVYTIAEACNMICKGFDFSSK